MNAPWLTHYLVPAQICVEMHLLPSDLTFWGGLHLVKTNISCTIRTTQHEHTQGQLSVGAEGGIQ